MQTEVRTQNTIHRLTGTTGTGAFAPRQVDTLVHAPGATLEVYAVLDTDRLPLPSFVQALADIGANGYGRDASTGLGKFTLVGEAAAHSWPTPPGARHALTLAPCAPVPADLDAHDCHYQPVTRFGRHGGLHVLTGRLSDACCRRCAARRCCPRRHPSDECPAFHGQGSASAGAADLCGRACHGAPGLRARAAAGAARAEGGRMTSNPTVTRFFTTQALRLTPLTPIHIGCGIDFEPT
ncbi:MAG: hypothetical protein IPG57_10380, partial [Burkholderiales bacterium]|nr:hypothetical protein [Burkholderiales bacterium]